MSDLPGRPPTSSLIADALGQTARLVESEIRLVRTEISEKLTAAIWAVAIIAASAVVLVAATFLLLIGFVHLLIYFGLLPFVAYFAVGLVGAVIGAIAVLLAIRHLKPSGLTPRRSLNQISKDAQAIKEQMS